MVYMSKKKSFIAKIAEAILKLNKPKYMDSKDNVDDFINNKLNSDEKEFKPIFNIKKFLYKWNESL